MMQRFSYCLRYSAIKWGVIRMSEYVNEARGKLTLITRGGSTIVRISPASDLIKDTKEIRVPLEVLMHMVAEQ